jgi:hypothetical protein
MTSLLFISYEVNAVALAAADFRASFGASCLFAHPGKIIAAASSNAEADNPHFLFIVVLLSHVKKLFPLPNDKPFGKKGKQFISPFFSEGVIPADYDDLHG